MIILEHVSKEFASKSHFPSLPPGCFPALPPEKPIYVKIPWHNMEFKIKIRQMPVISSFAVTGHKTQGRTLPRLAIAGLGTHLTNYSGWLYVALPRCRELANLYRFFSIPSDVTKYKPRKTIMAFMHNIRSR
jgi:hypothetical protein